MDNDKTGLLIETFETFEDASQWAKLKCFVHLLPLSDRC